MKVDEYRSFVRVFLNKNIITHQRYRITEKKTLHLIDSQYIINEIIDSSDEEIEVFFNVFRQMDTDEEVVHRYLEYMSEVYIKANKL